MDRAFNSTWVTSWNSPAQMENVGLLSAALQQTFPHDVKGLIMVDLDEGDATIRTPDGQSERVMERLLNAILQTRQVGLCDALCRHYLT